MEEKAPETAAKKCTCSGDCRTFWISLLTAIIVVVVYHAGLSVCRMICGGKGCPAQPCVRYMLVPVMEAPGHGFGHGPGFGHGFKGGKHFPKDACKMQGCPVKCAPCVPGGECAPGVKCAPGVQCAPGVKCAPKPPQAPAAPQTK